MCHTRYFTESHNLPACEGGGTPFVEKETGSERLSDLLKVTEQTPKFLMAVQPALGRREAGCVPVEVGAVGEGERFSARWSHHQTDEQEKIQCMHTYGNATYTRE